MPEAGQRSQGALTLRSTPFRSAQGPLSLRSDLLRAVTGHRLQGYQIMPDLHLIIFGNRQQA